MPKILFVLDGLWVGGTERSIVEMVPLLNEAGFQSIIVCFRHHLIEGVEKETVNRGHHVCFIEESSHWKRLRAFRRLIRTEKPDLIHTSLFYSNLLGRLAGIRIPIPVVCSLVNTPYHRVRLRDPNLSWFRVRLVQTVDRVMSRWFTTHFHAVSGAARDAAIRDLGIPSEKITVVPRGRDRSRLGEPDLHRRNEARRMLGIDRTQKVIANVARHEFQKGQVYLLEAAARLLSDHPELVVLIAGRAGTASSDLKRIRDDLNLKAHVRILGHVDHVPEILAAADVFVFPSLFEGIPGAVIEAMALGLPVVASSIPAVLEVVEPGKNALLVPPGSAEQLANAVSSLLSSPELQCAFGSRSREIFLERFTIETSTKRMIGLYENLISGRSHSLPVGGHAN